MNTTRALTLATQAPITFGRLPTRTQYDWLWELAASYGASGKARESTKTACRCAGWAERAETRTGWRVTDTGRRALTDWYDAENA